MSGNELKEQAKKRAEKAKRGAPIGSKNAEKKFGEAEWKIVEMMCRAQCSAEEICAYLKITRPTLNKKIKEVYGVTFKKYFDEQRQAGFASLRYKRFEMAMNGNVPMMKHLLSHWLGENDQIDVKTENVVNPENLDFSSLSTEELIAYKNLQAKVLKNKND